MTARDTLGHAASPRAVVPAAWLTAILLRRDGGAQMALGTSLAYVVTELLKHEVSRRRPSVLERTPWRSFPSGHSAASTAYLLGLALAAQRYRAIGLGAACLGAAAVNTLRVGARRHWPSDVVAGDVVGVLGILTAHLALGAVRRLPDGRSPTAAEAP